MPPPDEKSAGIRALWEGPARRREVVRVAAALQGGTSVLLRVQAGHAGPALDAVECQVIGKGRTCSRVVWDGHAYDEMGTALGNPATDWEAPLAEPPGVLALEVRDVPAGAAGGVVAGHELQVLDDVLRFVRGMQGRREADRNTVVVACDLPMWGDVCKKVEKEVGLVVEDATVHGEQHVLEFLEACKAFSGVPGLSLERAVQEVKMLALAHAAEGSLDTAYQDKDDGDKLVFETAARERSLWFAQLRLLAEPLDRRRRMIIKEWIAKGLLPDKRYYVKSEAVEGDHQVDREHLEFSWFWFKASNESFKLPLEHREWAKDRKTEYKVLRDARNALMHFKALPLHKFKEVVKWLRL